MPRTTRLAAIAVVLVTATSGLIQTAGSASAAPDHQAGPAYSGREVFKIVARVPGPRHATARAWGAFTATGHFIRKDAMLTFPKGRIVVRRHVQKVTYGGPNLRTCRFTIVQRGTFVVRKATGAYRGLHESGHFTSKLYGRLRKTGTNQCGSRTVAKRTVTYEIGKAS
ncbi:MAG TPA: hypothetical protein VF162_20135 [Streptosporangiaceae bacterium]